MTVVRGNIWAHPIPVRVSAPAHLSPAKRAPYLQGRPSYRLLREFHELRKRYGGQPLGAGQLLCDGGCGDGGAGQAVHRRSQEDSPNFQVWDETQSLDTESLQSDSFEHRG
jgi:hypothetical protein